MRVIRVPTGMGSGQGNPNSRLAPAEMLRALPKGMRKNSAEAEVVPFDIGQTNKNIEKIASESFRSNTFCLFLGGDHSITRPLFSAFAAVYGHKNAGLVVFDAHADIDRNMHRLSHAAYLRTLAEEGVVHGGNAMLAALYFESAHEISFMEKNGIARITLDEFRENPRAGARRLLDFARGFENIYISIDLDVFSSIDAPAAGADFEAGMRKGEFFPVYRALLQTGRVRALDITEADFYKERGGKTLALCRKMITEADKFARLR